MNHEPLPAQGPVDVVVGQQDTYPMPEHGWTCFHCGETFTTPGAARDHFGPTPNAEPGCTIKVQLGGERGLLNALRKAEARLVRYMEEDTDLHRAIYAMQSRHSDALMAAEEAGYARGLRDGMNKTPNVEVQRDSGSIIAGGSAGTTGSAAGEPEKG